MITLVLDSRPRQCQCQCVSECVTCLKYVVMSFIYNALTASPSSSSGSHDYIDIRRLIPLAVQFMVGQYAIFAYPYYPPPWRGAVHSLAGSRHT